MVLRQGSWCSGKGHGAPVGVNGVKWVLREDHRDEDRKRHVGAEDDIHFVEKKNCNIFMILLWVMAIQYEMGFLETHSTIRQGVQDESSLIYYIFIQGILIYTTPPMRLPVPYGLV